MDRSTPSDVGDLAPSDSAPGSREPTGYALVSGASGFVGNRLVRRLVMDDWDVTVLTHRHPAPTDLTVRHVATTDGSGARGPDALRGAIDAVMPARTASEAASAPPRVCFHLATHFRAVHEPSDIAPMVEANVAFGAVLAEALDAATIDCFLNVGTVWQHFGGAPYSPVSLYAATKQAFADVLTYYREVTGLPVATVELADTYGPGDPRAKLLPLLARAARTGETVELSTGDQLLDLVYVTDAVDALVVAAHAGASGDRPVEPWSATSGAPLRIREVVALVEEVSGRRIDARWGVRPRRPREMVSPWVTGARPPGWAPRVALADGLRELLAAGPA